MLRQFISSVKMTAFSLSFSSLRLTSELIGSWPKNSIHAGKYSGEVACKYRLTKSLSKIILHFDFAAVGLLRVEPIEA